MVMMSALNLLSLSAYELASGGCAFVAAIYWLRSALVSIPPLVAYFDKAPEDDPFLTALRNTARLNRFAAVFSALSGFFAVAATITHLVSSVK